MADLTLAADLDAFLASANDAAARTELGLTDLATTTPGANVATALAAAVAASGGISVVGGAGGPWTDIGATGLRTWGGTKVTTASAMAALAIDVTKALNTKSISVDSTFTFSGAPGASNQWFGMRVTNSDGSNARTLTIPSSFSVARGGAITSIIIPANGVMYLVWCYDGSTYFLFGDPPLVSGTGSFLLATAATSTNQTLVTPILGVAQSGQLGTCTVDGTNLVGFRGAPQNIQTGDYTLVLTDAGKCIYYSGAAGASTLTIPANASVAFVIGTIIEIINMDNQTLSIAITSDTLTLLPAGTTGSVDLVQYGRASLEKVTSTSWVISGNSALT